MRIATWNVNSVRARLPLLLSWLEEESPEVVLLQELKCVSEAFPADPLRDLGYNLAVAGQKTYNGVGILSKFPLEDIMAGLPDAGEGQPARYIEAFTGGIRVASVYVPNGQETGSPAFTYKLEFFRHLEEHLRELNGYDEIVCIGGDYNVAPTDADVYDPKRWHEQVLCSQAERNAYARLLDCGYADAAQGCGYTWWDYRGGCWPKDYGLKIDHLLVNGRGQPHIRAAGTERRLRGLPAPSDHVPVWCDLAQ